MEEYKITLFRDDKLLIITTPLSFYKVDDNTRKYQDMKLPLLSLIVFLISSIRNLYILVTWYQIYYNTILSKSSNQLDDRCLQ